MQGTNSDALQEIVEKVPPLPAAASEALSEIGKSDADTGKLTTILGKDPVLVGRILRVANSPFYGLPRQVSGVRDACVILGQHTLRNIISSAAAMEVFSAEGSQSERLLNYWQHASFTAGVSYYLAKKTGQDRESAFTAGLLLDIGCIAIECLQPVIADQIFQRCADNVEEKLTVECELLGYSHAQLGGEITRYWHLPEEVVNAVALRHEPQNAQSAFCDLIHLSDHVARGVVLSEDSEAIYASFGEGVANRLKLDNSTLKQWIDDLPDFKKE